MKHSNRMRNAMKFVFGSDLKEISKIRSSQSLNGDGWGWHMRLGLVHGEGEEGRATARDPRNKSRPRNLDARDKPRERTTGQNLWPFFGRAHGTLGGVVGRAIGYVAPKSSRHFYPSINCVRIPRVIPRRFVSKVRASRVIYHLHHFG